MSFWEICKGLVWKVFRESWLLALALFLLPPAGYFYVTSIAFKPALWPFIKFAFLLLMVLWGAQNGERQNRKRALEASHLPIDRFITWIFYFWLPIMVLVDLSRWADYWYKFPTYDFEVGITDYCIPIAFYAVSYLLSSSISKWIALMVGALLVVVVPSFYNSLGHYSADFSIILSVGSIAASFVYLVMETKTTAEYRRTAALAVLISTLLFAGSQPASKAISNLRMSRPLITIQYNSDDASSYISSSNRKMTPDGDLISTATFINMRTNIRKQHAIKSGWMALDVVNDRDVYLLQGRPDVKIVRVTKWDTDANKLETIVELPIWPNSEVLYSGYPFSSADPQGRYLALKLPAIKGYGWDLWIVDISLHKAHVVMQNAIQLDPHSALWSRDSVLIPSYGTRILHVDINSMKASWNTKQENR